MTSTLRKRLGPALLGSSLALGLMFVPASAEELRIGFLAPLTGGLAQTGIDMRDGFQLYLDEHGGKLGGMDVKMTVEDEQGKGDVAVTKAKKLVLQDKVHMLIGGVLASTGYALAPVSTRNQDALYPVRSSGRRPDPAAAQGLPVPDPHLLVVLAAAPRARAICLRPGHQDGRDDRGRLCLRL